MAKVPLYLLSTSTTTYLLHHNYTYVLFSLVWGFAKMCYICTVILVFWEALRFSLFTHCIALYSLKPPCGYWVPHIYYMSVKILDFSLMLWGVLSLLLHKTLSNYLREWMPLCRRPNSLIGFWFLSGTFLLKRFWCEDCTDKKGVNQHL